MSDDLIDQDLLQRIKARAEDPARRSGASSLAANSTSLDSLLGGLPPIRDPGMRAHVDRMQGLLGNMLSRLGGAGLGSFGMVGPGAGSAGGIVSFGGEAKVGPLPQPCSEDAVRAAEAALGFALPPPLRQLYLEVADGGFGPGNGIYSLDELVAKYSEMTREPAGPNGELWPARLLPINGADWDLVSIDRDSARLVFWDVEEIEEDESRSWDRSFKDEAESLAAWLAAWVEAPTHAEQMESWQKQATATGYKSDEDIEKWFRENPGYEERARISAMTPEERAAMGLPEVGWEEIVWGDYKPGD